MRPSKLRVTWAAFEFLPSSVASPKVACPCQVRCRREDTGKPAGLLVRGRFRIVTAYKPANAYSTLSFTRSLIRGLLEVGAVWRAKPAPRADSFPRSFCIQKPSAHGPEGHLGESRSCGGLQPHPIYFSLGLVESLCSSLMACWTLPPGHRATPLRDRSPTARPS